MDSSRTSSQFLHVSIPDPKLYVDGFVDDVLVFCAPLIA